MASQNKIVEIIFGIKTIYPYYAKETDVESLVKTWGMLLNDVPDDMADAAFYAALRVCKVPPTPADLLEQIRAMRAADEPSPEELWVVYHKALTDTMRQIPQFAYTYVDSSGISQGQQARNRVEAIWASLPEPIKHYLSSKGEMIRQAQQMAASSEEDTGWEKQRFMKSVPVIVKRAEYSGFRLEGADRMRLTGGGL